MTTAPPDRPNPTDRYPRPGFPEQDQPHPGYTELMRPRPDHGEDSYHGNARLEDLRTVVTGGDSGIGRAIVLAFAREGADVLFTHLPEEEEEARETSRLVHEAGRRAVALPCDLRDEGGCQRVADRTVREFGRIDVLVNNAAYQMAQPDGIEAITTAQFHFGEQARSSGPTSRLKWHPPTYSSPPVRPATSPPRSSTPPAAPPLP